MIIEETLRELASQLVDIAGVQAVVLGGSRARGEHTPASDVDLGLYYRPPLDLQAIGELAGEVSGDQARVMAPGSSVDGGAWLHIDGTAVDWIYRDLYRVCAAGVMPSRAYCLPPEIQQRIIADPPPTVDAFTDAVIEADGLDPVLMVKRNRLEVRRIVCCCLWRADAARSAAETTAVDPPWAGRLTSLHRHDWIICQVAEATSYHLHHAGQSGR